LIILNILVSSANKYESDSTVSGRSFIYITKRIGPSTEPCGIPDVAFGRSTSLQLLEVLDKWTEALDNGHYVDCIYMDFQKAFDKVPHKRLLEKIKSYA
jgi:hypothetical protein